MNRAELPGKAARAIDPRARSGFAPVSESLSIPANAAEALARLSRQEGVSLSEALLAAFQTILHRYTLQEEIAVGLPGGLISGGSIRVSRREFGGDPPFRSLLASADVGISEESAFFPKAPEPSSSAGEKPGFSRIASVLFDPGKGDAIRRPGRRFELALHLPESPGALRGAFLYDPDVFESASIRRLCGHFLVLLDACAAAPDERVGSLPLATPLERQQVLFEWNDTAREPPSASSVAQLFERQAARTPASVAVQFGHDRLTYGELDRLSNRLAHALSALGVGPGVPAGICLERSLEAPVAVLAVLKAGGAYVALDPEYPRERLEFMLEDSGAPVVLTDERSASRIPVHSGKTVVLGSESGRALLAELPDTPVDREAGPHDLAYVIYTSGSTGKPKGVAMPHGALVNLLAWQTDAAVNPAAKTLQFASLNFDVSFQEMFSTWCGGGTLVLVSETVRRDAAALWRLLAAESVERLCLPFVALQHLAESAEREGAEAPKLMEVITAGEQLQITPQIARLFAGGKRRLQNQYGPSESHVVTAFTLAGPPEEWPTLPPIGRPIANTQIYILDRGGNPVPAGVPGELYIGGAGVARGYWNRPELTAEKFVPDPFGPDATARLYRTGDLARYREDKEIEFLGRLDQQVKIRGFRVEPGEIEGALAQHRGVRESVVVARSGEGGSRFLVAYVVARTAKVPPAFELRSFLKEMLPDYMIPSAFVAMESLPLTPSGKVDRRALPAPGSERPELEKPFRPPRDPLELELARLWEKAFRIDRVGVDDDFFELGGHSLIAGQLFADIRKSFGNDLPPTTLLRAPTIGQLAEFVRGGQEPLQWTSLVPIQPEGSLPPLFCMHAGAGTVLYYRDLAQALGPDQPIYGLQAQGLYGDSPPHAEVEEMAAHYIREIRTVQPTGPYYLAGFCFGGLLSFAVAERLRSEGSEVGLLASFDGGSSRFDYAVRTGPDVTPGGAPRGTRRHWIWLQRERFRRVGRSAKASYIATKLKNRLGAWKRSGLARVHFLIGDFLRRRGRPLPDTVRQTYFRTNSERASERYDPKPYPGSMVIFETRGLFRDPHLGWDGLVTGRLEVCEIASPAGGDERYHSVFIPALAEPLKEVLRAARTGREKPVSTF